MAKLEIEYKKIDDVIPYINNARTHPPEQIAKIKASIAEFGMATPIGLHNNTIVYGHGRIEALKQLGETEVPTVDLSHLSDSQKKAYILQDNRTALDSGWDIELLKIEIQGLDDEDFDLSLTGFDDDELNEFLKEDLEPQSDEDDVPEIPEEPITKEGDIWILGNHRVMCGDSTSIDAVEKLMDGNKADLLFTDPPYNQETDGGFKGEIGKSLKQQSSEIEHLCNFHPSEFLQTIPLLFNKSMNAYIFCNKDLIVDYLIEAREQGYSYNILIWKKPNAIPLGGSFRPDIEYLITFRKSAIWNSSIDGVSYSKVMDFERVKNKVHPTMKPIELIENQLKISSNNNSIVADLFGGSGSTLIACEKTNRNARLMELDPKYVDVIVKRWQEYTGKEAILESTNETFNSLLPKEDAA